MTAVLCIRNSRAQGQKEGKTLSETSNTGDMMKLEFTSDLLRMEFENAFNKVFLFDSN